jgi:hypothetical protein
MKEAVSPSSDAKPFFCRDTVIYRGENANGTSTSLVRHQLNYEKGRRDGEF